jgi:hypothetical protein
VLLKDMNGEYEASIKNNRLTCEQQVCLKPLKAYVTQQVPTDWPLRRVLLEENDSLDISIFLSRLPLYLRLIRMGGNR